MHSPVNWACGIIKLPPMPICPQTDTSSDYSWRHTGTLSVRAKWIKWIQISVAQQNSLCHTGWLIGEQILLCSFISSNSQSAIFIVQANSLSALQTSWMIGGRQRSSNNGLANSSLSLLHWNFYIILGSNCTTETKAKIRGTRFMTI